MESTLKYLLYIIFLVSLVTGVNVLFGGAGAIPGSLGSVDATVDNELRFFSVFWISFGAFCCWVAWNVRANKHFIPSIATIFFIGGIGRLISTLSIGPPSSVLIVAMVLEFVLPVFIFIAYQKI